MPFDYQMVTYEEIIKNDFFKWALYRSFASFIPHALKGQKLLAQGSALGNHGRKFVALQGQKLLNTGQFIRLLPLLLYLHLEK